MAIQGKVLTAEELSLLPDDGQRHELVRGRLIVMAPPGEEHSWLQVNLIAPLAQHVRGRHLGRVYGELGCKLETNPDTVRATDAAFIRQERLTGPPQPDYWLGAPDLVVEVISPNDRYTDVDDKVATWLAHGARMVLVINPRWRTILVHRPEQAPRLLTEQDTLDGADVVPGWQIAVREIFA